MVDLVSFHTSFLLIVLFFPRFCLIRATVLPLLLNVRAMFLRGSRRNRHTLLNIYTKRKSAVMAVGDSAQSKYVPAHFHVY